jgi:hypothetical protein
MLVTMGFIRGQRDDISSQFSDGMPVSALEVQVF